ncbi:hypothetical protein [Caulobacter sp. BK020]|uniref:hypothetical protein n=1 Tax=Caulobacter sp. BK020 TaxID=2512117 RepID=UPI00104286A0|nr:hypothetical protein [Caulobacter sp. BK020]TCS18462.1 hypothetical protein EV278_101447 [Caulobacter sp. BK020]
MRLKAGLAVALLMASLSGCASRPRLPATPLFAGLTGADWEDAKATQRLRQQIGERFPIGTPEAGLADYLSSQGMGPVKDRSFSAGAVGLCKSPVLISWTVDGAGRISDLSVFYSDTGCL